MKILSWEGIRVVLQEQDKLKQRDNMFRLEAIARAQRDLTLRQVRELLDGIENPHQRSIDEEGLPEDVWSQRIARSNISIWNEAIQTMKALLEE